MDEEEKPFDCYQPKQAANPRGLCCVIANFCGESYTRNKQIYTKDRDVKMIKDFFKTTLGYGYKDFINTTKEEFNEALNWIKNHLSLPDNKTIDRLFLFVLSHGSDKGIRTCQNDGKEEEKINGESQIVPVEMITSFFDHSNIPSLKDQPKCIFIQACRGNEPTKISAIEENQDDNKTESSGPSTYVEGTELVEQGDRKIEAEQQVPQQTEFSLRTPRAELRPSSENILVCFACQKWNVSYVSPSQGAYFISILINTLETNYENQHLLDMIVEVTRKFGKTISPDYFEWSLLFPHDSSYQAELSLGTGLPDVPFSVHAISSGNINGEVKKFDSHHGIIIKKSKKIENRSSLKCALKHKRSNPQMQITLPILTIQEIEDNFLKHGHFEIDDKNSLLFNDKRTIIGFGKVTTRDQKVVGIDHEVIPTAGCTYHIVYKMGEDLVQKNVEFIIGKECRIWKHSPTGDDKRLVAVGEGKKGLVPYVEIDLYQLPIFESTLTKKFYLAEPPKFPDQDTLDGNIRPEIRAGGSSRNGDVARSSVSGNLDPTMELLKKQFSDLNVHSSREDECDRYCKSLADELKYVKENDEAIYHRMKGKINNIVYQMN